MGKRIGPVRTDDCVVYDLSEKFGILGLVPAITIVRHS